MITRIQERNPNSRSVALAGAGLVVLIALGSGLVIWPNYREWRSITREIEHLQSKVQNLDAASALVDKLAAQLEAANRTIERDLKVIPESADTASLIRRLSLPVDGVTVLDQTFTTGNSADAIAGAAASAGAGNSTKASAGAAVQALPVTVEMEATFESVFALLRSAESMNRLVRVASVRMQSRWDDKAAGRSSKSAPATLDRDQPVVRAVVGLEAIHDPQAPIRNDGSGLTRTEHRNGTADGNPVMSNAGHAVLQERR